ncbi:hypothetical protein CBM2595_A80075 [Cupriavidus taiwanensis]|nr:hypothetical protein CBM2595_A80075 [Cupriavidus taiwanensis]
MASEGTEVRNKVLRLFFGLGWMHFTMADSPFRDLLGEVRCDVAAMARCRHMWAKNHADTA